MRWLLFSLVATIAACSDSSTTNPAGGSSGVPNATSSSGGTSSGNSSSGSTTKKDAGGGDDDDTTGDPDSGPPLGPANVRIMAANISTGTKQSYDPGEGIRIFQAMKPDVVMIQEFNYGDKSDDAIKGFVTSTFGAGYAYFRETGNIPNGVITKYPITDSGHFDSGAPDRGFAWAKITMPGGHSLYAFSVHLRTTSPSVRSEEAGILVDKIGSLKIADTDYLAIGGDFNSENRGEDCLSKVNAVVDAAGSHATDGNSENTNANRGKPYDWMLASPNLVAHQVPTIIGANSFDKGLVFDSRVYTPIEDVAPVKKADSAAEGMQHMAIIKDFHLE